MSQTQSTGTTTFTTKHNSELSDSILEAISVYTDKRKKPKRNRSAFILFSIDIRKKTQYKDLDNLNPNDKFVRIAELWKEASEEERRYYEEKAKQEKERYTSELNDFCSIFPSEPIQRPRNHIKKPCNAYGYYLKDIKEEIRKKDPEPRMCEVLRIVGEKWKHLSPEEKQKYEAKAEISRKQFKAEVSKQMETVKKVKISDKVGVPSRAFEQEKTSKAQSPEDDELTTRDLYIPKFEAPEPEEPKLRRSTSTDKKNILANLFQSQQENTQPENKFTSNALNLNNVSLSAVDLNALSLSLVAPNKNTALALQSLYWKVEGLRQHILLQMQSAMNGNRNVTIPSLFGQANQDMMSQKSNNYESPNGELTMKEEFN